MKRYGHEKRIFHHARRLTPLTASLLAHRCADPRQALVGYFTRARAPHARAQAQARAHTHTHARTQTRKHARAHTQEGTRHTGRFIAAPDSLLAQAQAEQQSHSELDHRQQVCIVLYNGQRYNVPGNYNDNYCCSERSG